MATTQSAFLNHSHGPWEYHVYISFRGDTRKNFTDHLYSALCQAGINTFRDEEEVRKGETLSSEFERAIQNSRISIIVFSKDYASSRWCLDELVEILKCKQIRNQVVLPIFYNVNPSQVSKQTGKYGTALARHQRRFGEAKVKSWRDALTKVGEFSGWDLQQEANGYESRFINKIIKEVLSLLARVPMFVAKYPVGLDSRVEDIVRLMHRDINDDVQFIGIYGMGGIGKTTLVKAVYNHVFEHFDSSCFLEIRSKFSYQHSDGRIALQQELLNKLLQSKIKVHNVDEGIILIKERLRARKSLIVLDDLDHLGQLDALAGERNWFGAGTRVILTTRDKHILKDLKVEGWYMVKELDKENSLRLFSQHAFKIPEPSQNYTKLSENIVSYCKGLPLALEVLGVHLSNKKVEDWRSAIERLKTIPNNEVHTKLKISFDGLSSKFAKDIFLDLACHLPEVIDKQKVINKYDVVPRCFPTIEIEDLIDKSLIIIDEYDRLHMHTLIREMGKEIVYVESSDNPSERSRLCYPNEINEVLLRHKGKPAVRFFKDEWGRLAEIEERVTLVGKFLKGRPPLELIREKFQSTFSLTGSTHVGSLDFHHILIRFSREDDCEKVLAKGLAMVAGKPMRLTRWSPDWSTRKESPLAPVWVLLPGLPYHLFDRNSLKHLCRPVGKLLALDSATARRTRPSVARVKLELDLLKPLVDEIWIGFADEGVDPEDGFWQRLEYENVPTFCSKCFKFGHLFTSCKSGSDKRTKGGEISGSVSPEVTESGPVGGVEANHVTPKQSKKRSLKPVGLGVGVQTRSMRRKGHRADSISPHHDDNSTENVQTQNPFLASQSNSFTPIDLIKRNQNTLPIVPLEDTSCASIDHKSPHFSSTINSNATPSSFPPFSNLVPFSNRARSSAKRTLLFTTPRQYRELEGIHGSRVISQSRSELDDEMHGHSEDNDLRSNEVTDLLVGLDYG